MDRAFFDCTGLPEELVYRQHDGWMQAVHPDDLDRARAMWALAPAHLDAYDLELRVRRADGTYCMLRGTAVPVWENGELVAWEGSALIY